MTDWKADLLGKINRLFEFSEKNYKNAKTPAIVAEFAAIWLDYFVTLGNIKQSTGKSDEELFSEIPEFEHKDGASNVFEVNLWTMGMIDDWNDANPKLVEQVENNKTIPRN